MAVNRTGGYANKNNPEEIENNKKRKQAGKLGLQILFCLIAVSWLAFDHVCINFKDLAGLKREFLDKIRVQRLAYSE